MDSIRTWAETVCFAALAAGIAGIITPSGKLEKSFKFAVSLFFLCCMLTPLFCLKNIRLPAATPMPKQSTWDNSTLSSVVEDETINAAQDNVVSCVTKLCRDNGIEPVSVNARVEKTKDGMDVHDVTIKLNHSDMQKSERIRSVISERLGLDVSVEEGENNGNSEKRQ